MFVLLNKMSFRDAFTREDSAQSNFDDYAFLYFSGAALTALGVSLTFGLIRRITNPSDSEVDFPVKSAKGCLLVYPETSSMKAKVSAVRSAQSASSYLRSSGGFARLLIIAIVWGLVALIVGSMGGATDAGIKSFDPYRILEIVSGATEADIKRAYRKQSLRYHPDKNPDDPLANANFIQVAKAYAALTDEGARKNYEKYGNPDGPQTMKVGIGLPRIFLVKENQVLFLVIFFLAILGLVPMLFILYYQKQKLYEANGVMVETLRFLSYYLNEATRLKNASELLACSAESRLLESVANSKEVAALADAVEDGKKGQFIKNPVVFKNKVLLTAHMQRLHSVLSKNLLKDLNALLSVAPKIVHSMVEISLVRGWAVTAMSMVEFLRCLVQGVDGSKESSLLQIPHFSQETLKHVTKGKGAAASLSDFLLQASDQRKGLVDFSQEQISDVDGFIKSLGKTEIEAKASVADEKEFVVGDIVTVEVSIDRTHLKEGQMQGPVHAPLFPGAKFEEWWIFLVEPETGNCICHDRIRGGEKITSAKLRFRLGAPGRKQFFVHVMNDSYLGLDRKLEVGFNVIKESEISKEVFVHPEDADLDKHPTLFQQMLNSAKAQEESEDEEEDEEPKKKEAVVENSDSE